MRDGGPTHKIDACEEGVESEAESGGAPAPKPVATASPLAGNFAAGDQISHAHFGEAKVMSAREDKLTIAFKVVTK